MECDAKMEEDGHFREGDRSQVALIKDRFQPSAARSPSGGAKRRGSRTDRRLFPAWLEQPALSDSPDLGSLAFVPPLIRGSGWPSIPKLDVSPITFSVEAPRKSNVCNPKQHSSGPIPNAYFGTPA
jgi:hypothetical protein